jgi:hypothetical protein
VTLALEQGQKLKDLTDGKRIATYNHFKEQAERWESDHLVWPEPWEYREEE